MEKVDEDDQSPPLLTANLEVVSVEEIVPVIVRMDDLRVCG